MLDDAGIDLSDGVCFSQRDAGESCFNPLDCQPGLFCTIPYLCNGFFTPMPCLPMGSCAPSAASGKPCTGVQGSCGTGVCAFVLPDAGGLCFDTLTAPGAACTGGACPSTFLCISYDGGEPICQRRPDGVNCQGPPNCESFHCGNVDAGMNDAGMNLVNFVCLPACL
jgi:hypothetical protein